MNADKDLEFGGCRSYRTARYLAWISTHTRVLELETKVHPKVRNHGEEGLY